MKTIILGSCRIRDSCKNINDLVKHNTGYTASLSQIIQSVKVMRGELAIPDYLESQVWKYPSGKDKRMDLSEIAVVVAEVSSLHSWYCEIEGQKIYLNKKAVIDEEICHEIPICHEILNCHSLIEQVNCFCNFSPNAKILLVPVHHYKKDSGIITFALRYSASKNNHDFFTPSAIIKQFGASRCLDAGCAAHYTKFMKDKIRDKVVEIIDNYSSSIS